MIQIKYSVIIPTRNGINYLKYAIESVLSLKSADLELIVSDNHSIDNTWEYINSLNDSRLKCIMPDSPLSMPNHFEFALSHSRGEWLIVIGDDDGIMPYFIEVADYLVKNFKNYNVINSLRAYYYYGGLESEYGNTVYSYYAHKKIKLVNSESALNSILYQGKNYFHFPQFYGGTLFKRSLYEQIKIEHQNKVFHTITPDAFSCVLILSSVESYVFSEIPLAWVGSSKKSTGFSYGSSQSSAKVAINDFKNLVAQDQIPIFEKFPNILITKDISLLFLESYFTMIHIRNKKYTENGFFHYLKFLKSYENYRSVSDNDKLRKVAFEEIFRLNNIKLSVIKYMLPYLYIVRCKAFIDEVILFFKKRFFVPIYIKTTDRQKFSDITKANDYIYSLWKEKKL